MRDTVEERQGERVQQQLEPTDATARVLPVGVQESKWLRRRAEFFRGGRDVRPLDSPAKPPRYCPYAADSLHCASELIEEVVICEGAPKIDKPVRNHAQDARCYEVIFAAEFSETRFVSMGNDKEVSEDRHKLYQVSLSLVDGLKVLRLIDRGDRTGNYADEMAKKGVCVPSRRSLESYLFDDEVLLALAASVGKDNKANSLLTKKNVAVDDLGTASGELYVACRGILDLTRCDNDTKELMRETLAPLIRPEREIYLELRRDIFGITD